MRKPTSNNRLLLSRKIEPMQQILVIFGCLCLVISSGCGQTKTDNPKVNSVRDGAVDIVLAAKTPKDEKVNKTYAEWNALLTDEQLAVLLHANTETPFKNEFWDHHEPGTYVCAGCGNELFSSEAKFRSGTGWPSFFEPIDETAVANDPENPLPSRRREVHCQRCGGHIGDVFDDGPQPTGLRFCTNSAAMKFVPARPELSEIETHELVESGTE